MADLPYVSRRAVKRARDTLPPPTTCRYCGDAVELVCNSELYGRRYGRWPYAYRCQSCDAHVGLHPETDLPLGTLADAKLRSAREKGKAAFDAVMHRWQLSRNEAYRWLAEKLGIPERECHWGWFEEERCEAARQVCLSALENKQWP